MWFILYSKIIILLDSLKTAMYYGELCDRQGLDPNASLGHKNVTESDSFIVENKLKQKEVNTKDTNKRY